MVSCTRLAFATLVVLSLTGTTFAQSPPAGIWQAAYSGNVTRVTALLTQTPGSLDTPDPETGATPLHWAAFRGQVDVVTLLLQRGAKVDARNKTGHAPLHNAAAVGADAVVKLLLATGADITARDEKGLSPRDWAVAQAHPACAELLAEAETALAAPLVAACLAGQAEAAAALVQQGADPNAVDGVGNTVLHLIAARGPAEAVEVAALAGADPRLRNAAGLTAHDVAAWRGDAALAGALAEVELWWTARPAARECPDVLIADVNGNAVALSSLRGKVVALFFYRDMSWDKNLKYPWLHEAQRLQDSPEAKRGDLAVVVCTPDRRDGVLAFLRDHGFSFNVFLDSDDRVRAKLGLYAMPAVVIDRNGGLLWQRRMWQLAKADTFGLRLAVQQALAGTPHAPVRAETPSTAPPTPPALFADFEHGYQGWSMKGACWGDKPATDAAYPGVVAGYGGRYFAQSFVRHDSNLTGIATSPSFTIQRPYIHFRLGGGDLADRTSMCLVVDGCAVRRAAGDNTAELGPQCWYVGDLLGKQAHVEIIDAGRSEARDYMLVDDILFADAPDVPECYRDSFDPNDPVDAVREKADFPVHYSRLLDGQVHLDVRPGRTYEIVQESDFRWPEERADWLACPVWYVPPTHVGHTLRKAQLTIDADGFHCESDSLEAAGRPRSKTLYAFLPAATVPGRKATIRTRFEVTANVLNLVAGPSPEPVPDLSPAERIAYTASSEGWYAYDLPEARALLDQCKLRRWPDEADIAFLLRASRWFVRDWTYSNVEMWGGRPSKILWPFWVLDSRTSDCGNAGVLAMILRANGIPASSVQGGWLNDKGEQIGAHVRLWVFLRGIGWVWQDVGGELLREGGVWDDNFVETWGGDTPHAEAALHQPLGKVLNCAEAKDRSWWKSRVIKQPELIPLSPNADQTPTMWRCTAKQPPVNWAAPGFDDYGWEQSEAGFGTPNVAQRKVGTTWATADCWLRREFTIQEGQITAPRLRVLHDGEAEIYINGALAATLPGYRQDYGLFPLSTEARRALKPGRAVLAVHCRTNGPPDYIDVGLVDVRP